MVTRTPTSVTFIRTYIACFATSLPLFQYVNPLAQHNKTHVPNSHHKHRHRTPHNSSHLTMSSFSTHSLHFLSEAPLATHTENGRLTTTMIMAYLEQKNWSVRLSLCMYVILSTTSVDNPKPNYKANNFSVGKPVFSLTAGSVCTSSFVSAPAHCM